MINKTKAKELADRFHGKVCDEVNDGELYDLIDQIYNSIAEEIDCEERPIDGWQKGTSEGNKMHLAGKIIGFNDVKKQNKDFKERLLK